ncbi:hypothetical protein, partial [Maricaulis sp.]
DRCLLRINQSQGFSPGEQPYENSQLAPLVWRDARQTNLPFKPAMSIALSDRHVAVSILCVST